MSKTVSKSLILLLISGLWSVLASAAMEPSFELKALGDSYFLPVSRGQNNGQLHGRFKAKNFEDSIGGTEDDKTHKFLLDVGAGGLMGNDVESYIIMPQAYYKFRNAPNNFQFTMGRTIRNYSDVDQYWMLGDVQPVFRWDVSRPEQQGLTGLFGDFKPNKNFSFTAFGSPVFLPTQGASYSIVSGKVTSSNPWFKPPVNILSISGVPYDLSYSIDTPAYSDIVFQPAFGAGFTVNNDDGSLFLRANYFNKVRNDLVLPFEGSVNIATQVGDIKVHPVAARHQLSTLDIGYKSEKFQAVASGIYESNVKFHAKDPWIYPHYSDQYKVALHLTAMLSESQTVELGALKTFNNKVLVQGLSGTGSLDIYSYRNQYDDVIDARWSAGFKARPYGYLFRTKMRYAYDYEAKTSLVSFEGSYNPLQQLTLFALADFFGGQKPNGTGYNNLMTDYLNNDRAQAGYVMCSKMLKRLSCWAVMWFAFLSLGLSSCSYFLDNKEDKNKNNSYDLSLNEKTGLNCVQDNTPLLRDYFDMKRDDTQIAKDLVTMKACLKDALNTFIKHTNGGQEGGGYSPGEIHRFLTSSFDQYTFAVDFLVEAMNLKNSLIGGSKEVVTKAELTTLMVYLDYVYDRLAFHATDRHLIFNAAPGLDRKKYDAAALRFQDSIKDFEKLPRKSEGSFDYAALVRLIPFFVEGQKLSSQWSDTFVVVNSFQALMSSGQKDLIDIKKLPFVVNNLVQIYTAYMEFDKFLKEPAPDKGDKDDGAESFFKDISAVFTFPGLLSSLIKNPTSFMGEKLDTTHHIQNQILTVLKNAVIAAPEQKLSQVYVKDLIQTFGNLNLLPSAIHAETLNGMIPLFFGRWLSSASCSQNCASDVVTVENIDMIFQIAAEWKERQVWVNTLAPKDLRQNISVPKVDGTSNLVSFQDVFSRMNHLHWRDYLMIGTNELTYKDMVIFNNIYTLVTIFTRPFNQNRSRAKVLDYYMTQEQTQALFEWFRDLGIELRIVDPRSVKSGNTAFIEINLFGSTAYDPEKLNFTEMLEYMEISISTGLRSVHWLENEFAECQIPGKVDVFNLMRLDSACFRPKFKANVDPYLFSYFPHMVDYLKTDPNANLETVLFYMEKASRQGLIIDNPFDTDSFRLMSSISQYAESMFMRFDKNRDNVIKGEEFDQVIAHVAPNIRKLIVDSLRDDSDPSNPNGLSNTLYGWFPEFEKNLVTYMVKNKSMPAILTAEIKAGQFYGAAELGAFKTWSDNMPSWLGNGGAEARREDFLLVVSGLSYFQRVQRISRIKKVLWDNDFSFDAGITDPNDKIFGAIADELACSSKIKPDVNKWLFDNQKVYWVKNEKDVWLDLWGFKITGSTFGITQNIYNWTDAVTEVLIQSLMDQPNLGPYCNMPYIPGVAAIRENQEPFTDHRECVNGYRCTTKRLYQPY